MPGYVCLIWTRKSGKSSWICIWHTDRDGVYYG